MGYLVLEDTTLVTATIQQQTVGTTMMTVVYVWLTLLLWPVLTQPTFYFIRKILVLNTTSPALKLLMVSRNSQMIV